MVITGGRAATATVLVAGGLVLAATPAGADRDYHTQRYAVMDGAQARGHVVNIHAEGPVNYGIERYQLVGAAPGAYQVTLTLHGDPGCTSPATSFDTAVLETNAAGNAHGGEVFTVEEVRPFFPPDGPEVTPVFGQWTFAGEDATYATGCHLLLLDRP